MTAPQTYRKRFASESGFSLVEMMVTTVLTLAVLSGTLGALRDGFKVSDSVSIGSEIQSNLRQATTLLRTDLLQTGQGIPTGGIPIPNGTGTASIVRPGPASLLFPAGSQVFSAVMTGQALGPDVLGRRTDVITLFYADSTLRLNEWPLAALAADGSTMTVDPLTDITLPGSSISAGDLIMFSNAFGDAIQHVTAVDGTQTVGFGANDSLNLNQRTAPAGSITQLQDAPGSYPPTTTRVWMVTYYVDDTNSESPRLMRVVNDLPPRPIALELEDLQITYDLVDGVTNPTAVDEPVAPNSASQIRKANLSLFGRSYRKLQGSDS